MGLYAPHAYAHLHAGVKVVQADLKSDKGQAQLHKLLASSDVLLTSFRPSALKKLGIAWADLHAQFPSLNMVSVVGSAGAGAEIPGHDLTYLAANDLVTDLRLPATLFADMAGALMASEAVLQAVLMQKSRGKGSLHEVALSQAAAWLALPRDWKMTTPEGAVGGAHAGYRLYACQDGRVAVAALEPHFAQRLCEAAGVALGHPVKDMFKPEVHQALAAWLSA
jgi:crotonobetainyl-CoA:carnitine CoA-transferase CaiB-like acyl-CoA transferase